MLSPPKHEDREGIIMPTTISPCLMFQNNDAEAAMAFYLSLFADGKIDGIERWGAEGPGKEGGIKRARFTISGQSLFVFDSPIKHAFEFTPSVSLFIECTAEDEIRRLAAALSDGGKVLMSLQSYGFSRLFAWVNDRHGVSWQVNWM
jgi:predicted 3-demethylubiquinone-9 3-methyltransferase (glyoxalase superfamily)